MFGNHESFGYNLLHTSYVYIPVKARMTKEFVDRRWKTYMKVV